MGRLRLTRQDDKPVTQLKTIAEKSDRRFEVAALRRPLPGIKQRSEKREVRNERGGALLSLLTSLLLVSSAALLVSSSAFAQCVGCGGGVNNNQATANVTSANIAAAGGLLSSNDLSELSGSLTTVYNNLGLGSAASLNAPAVGAITGFTSLEQWNPQTLPISSATLTCSGTAGNYPYNDDYVGTLGSSNVTYTLPTSGCADGSIITEDVVQSSSGVTVTNQTSTTGGIIGTPQWSIGNSEGNQILLQYQYCNGRCGSTDAKNAWVLRTDLVNPAQPWPVASGGTGVSAAGATAANNIGALAEANNLSDLASASTARTNLGLGSAAVVNAPISVANGGTGTSSPNSPDVQYLSGSTTTYTPPSGCTAVRFLACAAGGGGGGAPTNLTSGNCSGAGGGSGDCYDILYTPASMPSTITVAIGAAGAAGANGTSPTAGSPASSGTSASNTVLTLGSTTVTINSGAGGTASTGTTCGTLGTGGVGGTGLGLDYNTADPIAFLNNYATAASTGAAGTATATPSKGSVAGGRGGNGGVSNTSGTVSTPTVGAPGFIIATCYGATF